VGHSCASSALYEGASFCAHSADALRRPLEFWAEDAAPEWLWDVNNALAQVRAKGKGRWLPLALGCGDATPPCGRAGTRLRDEDQQRGGDLTSCKRDPGKHAR
jgi:hypothetical protein